MLEGFKNEAMLDFNNEVNFRAMGTALNLIEEQKGMEYPLIIGGERIYTEDKIFSLNPSKHSEIIGRVAKADINLAEQAMKVAQETFVSWRNTCPQYRARFLFNAAAELRRRKFEFSAWLVEEAGKSWPEADGDTAEAIDFLEYYGRQMVKLSEGMPVYEMAGEQNECNYIPLGVGIIIPPWNFPLAIMAGMTAAAIVAGNTVVLKPASTTPVIAAKFVELLMSIGLPAGVVNYLPGSGGAIGDYLVSHPQTRFINFTGSREVGIRIYELAAKVQPGQKWLKRVISEMGGKDAIVVAEDADLDEAALGIVSSAFGFQGQKCSACSRAIVDKSVYDIVLEKVIALAEKIKVGIASDFDNNMGPVIDKAAYDNVMRYIEIGKNEGRVVLGGRGSDSDGYYIEPTIIADVDCQARIAQEEIFGPVLAFIKAENYDHALQIANDTDFGLTGAVYSYDRKKLEKARQEFHVGNLYFNRKCTGALVGVHPFGGFNMSGTDSKAGGADYLLLFMQAKLVSEKL